MRATGRSRKGTAPKSREHWCGEGKGEDEDDDDRNRLSGEFPVMPGSCYMFSQKSYISNTEQNAHVMAESF